MSPLTLSQSDLSVVILPSCRVFHVCDVSGYSKGTNSATPRGTWLRLVREATGISHLREAILTLEETLRGLQAGEDKIEGGRMGMINMISDPCYVRRFKVEPPGMVLCLII